MSLQYTSTATSPNAAYTRLLYTVSGSLYTDQPQFKYLVDVYSGSTLLKRMTQGVNPEGSSTFDVARVVQGELQADYNWKISSVTPFNSSSKTFSIRAGEQFGTSISSSVTVYPDQATGSLIAFQGVVEPNAGYYNWDSSSYAVLSNMPATMSMQPNDFGTISVYNNNVSYVSQSFYSASSLVDVKLYSITDDFSSVPISSSLIFWDYVDVAVSSSIGLQNYRYEAIGDTCREKVRFAFINKLGSWDYYNIYNPVKQRIDVTRQEYTSPRVDYSSLASTYDISRRGKTVNDSSTEDQFTVDTEYLDKENANWLEELIESPEVYIQRNGEFIPVIITDTSYTSKTSASRQKIFKYTINFKPSNQPFGTWEPEYIQGPISEEIVTGSFDPTLGGTIEPYLWYDFSDTGSMSITGSSINGITSKGFYTASLVRGKAADYAKYNDTNWTAPAYTTQISPGGTNRLKYAFFDGKYPNPGGKQSSTLSMYYDTGSRNDYGYNGDAGEGGVSTALPGQQIFNTQADWTYITFFKPVRYDQNLLTGSGRTNIVSFRGNPDQVNVFGDQPKTYDVIANFNFDSSPTGSYDYYSSTISLLSSSQTFFENIDSCNTYPNGPSSSYAAYSYDGASGADIPGWVSSIGRQTRAALPDYPFSQSSTFELMREPSGSIITYTGSGTANEVFCDYIPGSTNTERLTIGSTAANNEYPGGNFYISHFCFFTQSLSDTQLNNLLDSYKSSSYLPVNAINN